MVKDWLLLRKWKFVTLAGLVILLIIFILTTGHKAVDFNSEVKPIFNKKCITCHGGVRQKADFSLLFRTQALAKTKSGKPSILPGDPEHSELIRRLTLKDPEERMPYKGEPLTAAEIDILRRWIREGAHWGDHWAYVAVKEVPVPKPAGKLFGLLPAAKIPWAKNDIDYFICDELKKQKLEPSPEASRSDLLKRVSMDLTGLPPTATVARQFLESKDPDAYERLVDSLLASPHYGEKWATMWLDIARYADSRGYEADRERPEIWKYRDWLIRAFNEDKPYNVFLTEQLAGDLLKSPTDDQMIATGFHRNTMTNDEGGTDNEEFRTAAVLDRVSTTWQGLMGTTFACVQCHSHPYDPFKHEEYYSFMAFFNDSRDEDTNGDYPVLRALSPADSVSLLALTDWTKNNSSEQEAQQQQTFLKFWQPSVNSIRADQLVNSALVDTKFLTFRNHGTAHLAKVDLTGKNELVYRYNADTVGGVLTIRMDRPNGPFLIDIKIAKSKNWDIVPVELPLVNGAHDLYFSFLNNHLNTPASDGVQFDWLHFGRSLPGSGANGYAAVKKTYWELLKKNLPGIPVMMENPRDMHRRSNVFERGNWLVKGQEVQPDVPKSLNPFPAEAPRNRLGLAMWITDKKNPLVSRTMVNRLWEQLFGMGLVETLEDMGTQGAAPTHQELIDWLAWKFMNENNWSIKKSLKEIVLSATYRQDAKASNELLAKDPYNRWYARGPRVRLTAEQVRDQALSASGLLSAKMYGPPVMPWQPPGIWLSPYNSVAWTQSRGEEQYRRAIYTYWKRTAPYPSMITFDGSSREVCTARRIRTNTPLQALVTLNDSVYLEASRQLALRMMHSSRNTDSVISKGYELLVYKPIGTARLAPLKKLYDEAYAQFRSDPERTCEMVGEPGINANPETAAFVVVAGALLNLDEVITN